MAKQKTKSKTKRKGKKQIKKSRKKAELANLVAWCGATITLALSVLNLTLYSTERSNVLGIRVEKETRQALLQSKAYWEEFLEVNPTYLDGWLMLADIAHKLEDFDYAKRALNSARSIDPNSDKMEKEAKRLGF